MSSVWPALASALADTLYEVGGYLLTRTSTAVAAGAVTLPVEGTHRWPTAGRVVVDGALHWYTGKTGTTLTGLTREDPDAGVLTTFTLADGTTRAAKVTAGLATDIRALTPVLLHTRTTTDLDGLRDSFFVESAEGADLDTLGRNFGWSRPRGLGDSAYRSLLRVLIYLDSTTIYAAEKVLDALLGPGQYEIFERGAFDPHTVFVQFASPTSGTYSGKAYLIGGEAQPRTSTTTVDVDNAPTVVAGIYASTDPDRQGTDYTFRTISGATRGPYEDTLTLPVPTFTSADVGRSVRVTGTEIHLQILSVYGPTTANLGRPVQARGTLRSGYPYRLLSRTDFFRDWMVGAKVQITEADNPVNLQTGDIVTVVSEFEVELNVATPFVSESDVSWRLIPVIPTASFDVDIQSYSVAGTTITVDPSVTLPANVLVDYTTVPSAQTLTDSRVSGVDQFAFYLSDDTWIVQTVLDLVTAAGVVAVVEVV
jgi:hypothetical protein